MGGSLTDSVALVTGGGRGIGRAIALALAREGAAIAIAARSPEELGRTLAELHVIHGRAIAVRADVTDRAAVERTVADTEARLGPIDFLVNNAGSASTVGPIWEVDPDEWWREVEVNLRGPLLCARAVLPGMIARRRGRIVNMASGIALTIYFCLCLLEGGADPAGGFVAGVDRAAWRHGVRDRSRPRAHGNGGRAGELGGHPQTASRDPSRSSRLRQAALDATRADRGALRPPRPRRRRPTGRTLHPRALRFR
jgi:short chain dehydrogenase